MPGLAPVVTLHGVDAFGQLRNITSLAILTRAEEGWLYAASRDGAIYAWSLGAGMDSPTLLQHIEAPAAPSLQNLTRLEVLDGPAGPHLLTGGVFGHQAGAYEIESGTGELEESRIAVDNALGAHLSSALTADGQSYLFTADRGGQSVQGTRIDSDFGMSGADDLDAGGQVTALATSLIGGQGYVFVAENSEQTISSYRIEADGDVEHANTLAAEEGLAFREPTALAVAEVDGVQFLVLAAAGTSSLSVIRIDETGALTAVDRVFDTLRTRFSDVVALDVVTLGDDVFVLAAGSDDGVSLFALLPGGRLHHLSAIADGTDTSLQNVETLASRVSPAGLTVFAGSSSEAGITVLEADLTNFAGAQRSGPGQTTMAGGEEVDILIATEGPIDLTGGAGADVFIFDPVLDPDVAPSDGDLGRIMDFQPDEDRIDLSPILALYELGRVDFYDASTRANIEVGPYSFEVIAATGAALDPADFTASALKLSDRPTIDPLNHPALEGADLNPDPEPDPDPDPDPDQDPNVGVTLIGTEARDTLVGSEWDDFIFGLGGNDRLEGGNGSDVLDGGDQGDLILGGNGGDQIEGGEGNDELRGEAGDDTIAGGAGADFIIGNIGDDVMTGSGLSDLVFGGPGNDFVNGGWGYDRINGGTGADKFFHIGIFDHGSDWVQDYNASDGDVLFFGNASAERDDFRVSVVETPRAGIAGVEEAFIVYIPTGQIMWALVDGSAQSEINLQIAGDSAIYDLFG
ncbi:MAG: hypothetical protein AAFM92_12920 [Pseudomonadota bacterium]